MQVSAIIFHQFARKPAFDNGFRYLITSSVVHLHSSLLFAPDYSSAAFSSFRSIPVNYSTSTERWFTASACTATVVGLLPSFIQHSITLQRQSIHGTPSDSGAIAAQDPVPGTLRHREAQCYLCKCVTCSLLRILIYIY